MRLKCRDGSPFVENLSNRRHGFCRVCILRGSISTSPTTYLGQRGKHPRIRSSAWSRKREECAAD